MTASSNAISTAQELSDDPVDLFQPSVQVVPETIESGIGPDRAGARLILMVPVSVSTIIRWSLWSGAHQSLSPLSSSALLIAVQCPSPLRHPLSLRVGLR